MVEDARDIFFQMMKSLGEELFATRYFGCSTENMRRMFLAVFDMHQERSYGVISAENLTDEEKEIIRGHYVCVSDIASRSFKEYDFKPREILSAMVIYRLELMPIFMSIPHVNHPFLKMCDEARLIFFQMIKEIGEELGRTAMRSCRPELMKRMFLAIFDMHQESSYRVITAENLTDEEKKIVSQHHAPVMNYTSNFFEEDSASRIMLSAMVTYRIEIVHILLPFMNNPRHQGVFHTDLRSLIDNEYERLRAIAISPPSRTRDQPRNERSHALYKHFWWKGSCRKFNRSFCDKFTRDNEDNYKLTD
ncbi:hypothetical protein PRIPAC_89478 [Pristionchus pacificus]|uniref:Uncharacterized protein n=1 Tax=Pristionchus pacificus TaxID=54126 RepID=A0A2A6B9D2_PRIPA|nr:hypothetical protein PRIPAC_89478 [Pristionchus pacificus]|eukprot:PDM62477.1 hypothetical protein PRIPAC_51919 [Pristionchus pacificus]